MQTKTPTIFKWSAIKFTSHCDITLLDLSAKKQFCLHLYLISLSACLCVCVCVCVFAWLLHSSVNVWLRMGVYEYGPDRENASLLSASRQSLISLAWLPCGCWPLHNLFFSVTSVSCLMLSGGKVLFGSAGPPCWLSIQDDEDSADN